MSKVIEFDVEVYQVGIGKTKTEKMTAKSLKRLLSAMPKQMKKKWIKITYEENGKLEIVENKSLVSNG